MNKIAVVAESESAPRTPIPVRIIDVDVHPGAPGYESVRSYLPSSWRLADWPALLRRAPPYATLGPACVFDARRWQWRLAATTPS